MRVAIIGRGLAALATAHYLIAFGVEVTLFSDEKGGTSERMETALLNPYPGRKGTKSERADEALFFTNALIHLVEEWRGAPLWIGKRGLIRLNWDLTKEKAKQFIPIPLESIGLDFVAKNAFLIEEGGTLCLQEYVGGLFSYLLSKGLCFHSQKITKEKELQMIETSFDHLVLAMGEGLFPLMQPLKLQHLPIQFIKGQSIRVKIGPEFTGERSIISNGHLNLSKRANEVVLGATYERNFTSIAPSLEDAIAHLDRRLSSFIPQWKKWEMIGVETALRVCQIHNQYLPYVAQLSEKRWLYTALGSRGILYHALYGRNLANLIRSR